MKSIEILFCYDIILENQMRKTIANLITKKEILNNIRNKYDVSFTLEVVPEIHRKETIPVLNPGLDVIDFCHATRTEVDIDYYILD